MRHIGAKRFQSRLCVAPRLNRQHFRALRNQHSGFALHLGAVLQVFNGFNPLGQLHFKAGKWFA